MKKNILVTFSLLMSLGSTSLAADMPTMAEVWTGIDARASLHSELEASLTHERTRFAESLPKAQRRLFPGSTDDTPFPAQDITTSGAIRFLLSGDSMEFQWTGQAFSMQGAALGPAPVLVSRAHDGVVMDLSISSQLPGGESSPEASLHDLPESSDELDSVAKDGRALLLFYRPRMTISETADVIRMEDTEQGPAVVIGWTFGRNNGSTREITMLIDHAFLPVKDVLIAGQTVIEETFTVDTSASSNQLLAGVRQSFRSGKPSTLMMYSVSYAPVSDTDEWLEMELPVGTKVIDYRNERQSPIIYMIQPTDASTAQDMWLEHVTQ